MMCLPPERDTNNCGSSGKGGLGTPGRTSSRRRYGFRGPVVVVWSTSSESRNGCTRPLASVTIHGVAGTRPLRRDKVQHGPSVCAELRPIGIETSFRGGCSFHGESPARSRNGAACNRFGNLDAWGRFHSATLLKRRREHYHSERSFMSPGSTCCGDRRNVRSVIPSETQSHLLGLVVINRSRFR